MPTRCICWAALASDARAQPPLVIAEHSSKSPLAERYGELVQNAHHCLKQGDAALSFYALSEGCPMINDPDGGLV